jgi:hypothetical protein
MKQYYNVIIFFKDNTHPHKYRKVQHLDRLKANIEKMHGEIRYMNVYDKRTKKFIERKY